MPIIVLNRSSFGLTATAVSPTIVSGRVVATVMNFWGYPEVWERMKEMGVDVKRLLHAKEEYEYLSPIYPGDVLTGVVSVESMRDGAMGMVAFKTTYSRGEETVLTAKMTIIIPPQKGGS